MTQENIFVRKGYVSEDLFKLNVVSPTLSSSSSIALNVESCDTWYGRLGHINLDTIRRMMNLNLIPKSKIDHKSKYEVCVQAKQTHKPFKPVECETELLELIHSDVVVQIGYLLE